MKGGSRMVETFTDLSRLVIRLADHEAMRFNHEYIGTEHLLLALTRDVGGVATAALKSLNLDTRKTRFAVERLLPGGLVMTPDLRLTPRARTALAYAIQEAASLKQKLVGPEHILLGLLRMHECGAEHVLSDLGVTKEAVRREVLGHLGDGPSHTDAS
ncbi:MAG TPA: Clp protease N-terminal domain-containing protein [Pirellulales bacterium]|nr:Clp protease N-terminal domain-containing protein [Pirellulales bacterium]